MAHLALFCLGPFQVTLDGQPVTGFKSNKVRALLAYLAVEADRPHPRERLAGLLWPDWPDRDALSNLRYTLSDLRRAIGDRDEADPPFLLIARDSLQFNGASDHWLDVATFAHLSSQRDLAARAEAVTLYRGSFLEGFSLGGCPAFEEWALFTREHLARQMSSTLHQLATAYEQRGEYEQARIYGRQQIQREPWDEEAHRQLMRLLALDGQRSAALTQYESCRRLLAEELGVEPAAETTRLYEQIRAGEIAVPPRTAVLSPELSIEPPSFLDPAVPAQAERTVFVARERQLAQLDGHLDAALAGHGRVVFVTGDAGSGKSALLQAFGRRALAAHPDLVVAGGQGNAHTGVGDPYLPFREVLGLLSGDVEAQWAAGAMTREQARRLWDLTPRTVEALVRSGPDLIDLLVPGPPLLERTRAIRPWPLASDGRSQLEELLARKVAASTIPALQQSALFEQYCQVLRTLAGHKPLLLTLDDLQWADGGSINLLFHLGRRLAGSRILLLGAYRPAEVALGDPSPATVPLMIPGELGEGPSCGVLPRERHPLEPVVNELRRTFGDVEVDLEQVDSKPFVEALLDSEPNRLDVAFRELLFQRTQGHPLFTVELLRGMEERGDLVQDGEGRWVEGPALDWETLPARVEAVIAERIGRLPQGLRSLLIVASVEGETFTAEVAARVQAATERETVRCLSETLDRQHHLIGARGIRRLGDQRLSRYRFRHILFQKYLYGSLDPVERAYLHEQVGATLEMLYEAQEIAEVAVQLARHFEEAGIAEKAVDYLHQAGDRAVQLSAYEEAILHLSRALTLLMTLPDSPERARQELNVRLALGTALIGFGSFTPETEIAYARARELGRQTGQTTKLCQALGDMAIFHYVRAEHRRAREVAEEALSQGQRSGEPLLVAWSHWHLGFILFGLGEYALARNHFEQVVALHTAQPDLRTVPRLPGADAFLSAMAYQACTLWCLGYPDQAVKHSQKALALARDLGHPFTLADVLCYGGCVFNEMRRDAQALRGYAKELRQIAEKIPTWLAPGTWHMGEAAVLQGQIEEGIALMRAGIATQQTAGKHCDIPRALGGLAWAQAQAGRPEESLAALAEGVGMVEETDERYWEAELLRQRAELLRVQGHEAEAEASLHQSLAVARRQRARSWELRATTSLARLWQAQGRTGEARQALAEVYGWFSEGFDTPDLQEARALLDELERG